MVMTVLQEVLTPARFRAWLEEQPVGALVGFTDSPSQCPLARYISAERDGAFVVVCGALEVGGHFVMPPRWVYDFQAEVDGPSEQDDVPLGRPVTREEALRLLNEVAI